MNAAAWPGNCLRDSLDRQILRGACSDGAAVWTARTSSLDEPRREPIRALLARALKRARGSLLWERLWPALAALATALGLFLALSWAGLWLVLPPLGARHRRSFIFGCSSLAAARAAAACCGCRALHDGLRRLDRGSGVAHRPATAIADEIAANEHDPVAQALWRAHVERALLSARKLKAGWPPPRLSLRDPMALRALVLHAGGRDLLCRRRRAHQAHRRRLRLAGRGGAGEFPHRRLGDAAGLYRPAAGDAAGPASGRDRAGAPRRSRCRPAASWWCARPAMCASTSRARAGSKTRRPIRTQPLPPGTEERRFIIKGDGSAALRGVGSDLDLDLHRHPGPRADHRR